MDLADDPVEAELRRKLRGWLADHLTVEWRATYHSLSGAAQIEHLRVWHRALYEAGFAARSWPERYGGRDGTLNEDLIIFDELARADAPPDVFRIGVRIVAPMLMKLASQQLQAEFLPPTADGSLLWSQGFSEPGAGSDLASLATRAISSDGGYRISGQKLWNTLGQVADYCLLLARTDTEARPHHGLTAFAVKMDSPGVSVRPLQQINGRQEFNEIFFDDVAVPEDAVVGEVNGGWTVAMTMLGFERRSVAFLGFSCRRQFGRLLDLAQELMLAGAKRRMIDHPPIRRRLAEFGVQARIAVLNNYRFAAMVPPGGVPGPEASVQKLHSTELNKAMHDFAFELVKTADLTDSRTRDLFAHWSEEYLTSLGMTIAGGTSQIQRNIIGERAIGLPR